LWPHSSSVIALTLRVDTPWAYISAKAATSAFSLLSWCIARIAPWRIRRFCP
jgi:hypothetical protein